MIKSIGTAAPVAQVNAAASSAAAKPVSFQISNFNTGIDAKQVGNSLVLSGTPHAPTASFGGMLSVKFAGESKDQFGAGVYVPVGRAPTLPEAAAQLAKQINEASAFKATVVPGKDGSITLKFSAKPADLAKLDAAVHQALHNDAVDNFITTAEARSIVAVAQQDGHISNAERKGLQDLMTGWTYYSDEMGAKTHGFEKPTLSETAGSEIQKALWPTE